MLLEKLAQYAHTQADQTALQGQNSLLTYRDLHAAVLATQLTLAQLASQASIALAVENHPAWVVLDFEQKARQGNSENVMRITFPELPNHVAVENQRLSSRYALIRLAWDSGLRGSITSPLVS